MSDNLKDLPQIPDNTDPALKKALNRLREAVQVLRANRGDPLDAAITWRTAIANGLAKIVGGGFTGGGTIGSGGGVIVGGGGGAYVPDLTPPPTVSGLSATAAISHVIVEFDAPLYTQGHGNERTVIYAVQRDPASSAPAPVFGDAAEVDSATGASPILAIPSNPDTKWFIWAKYVTVDGVESAAPAGGTNGVQVTTGQDVSTLLTALNNQITQSQLFAALGARINLIDDLAAVPGSVNARVATEASARASGDSALSTSIATVAASTATNAAAIATESTARASGDSALATSISSVSAVASGAAADIVTEASARASADSSLSSSISTLSSTVGTNTAAISAEATTRASVDGSLLAQYTWKLDVNGYVSGFGLASTSSGAAPTSAAIFRTDSFTIASPTGPGITPITPFIVVTTTTTINGVSVPVGVYMDAAYIANGTITNAKIGNAEIDDAKIANLSAAKLTAGSIAVGEYIQSTGFVAGSAGWRITGNGVAEFAAASIRGQLVASQIGAGEVTASKINVTSLDAITATIGTLRTASTGARMEVQDNKIRIYDSANVCRVKIGDLS